jgi:uroporphyrinogen-III decarboxylase
MTSKERVLSALSHREPDRIPVDFGGTFVTGIHVSCVAALREHYGLEKRPVKVIDPGQMLGLIEEDLKQAMGIDTEGVFRRKSRFGFANEDWKPWGMEDGLEVLVGGGFQVTRDENGDVLIYPEGDLDAPPSGRMPKGGFFFDAIVRQEPIDDDKLNPDDNLQEFGPISDEELEWLAGSVGRAAATGRAVVASFGGTALGDVGILPAPGLKHPKGIRDFTEWYISIRTRRDYIHQVFERQCDIAIANFERIYRAVGNQVDIVNVCGTDFGTQTSSFCSAPTFRELWMPYYQRVTGWIHKNTTWKTFKHSCGAVEKFMGSFIDSGFDVINPVQCSAAGMEPEHLKDCYGGRLAFWGGGVDTQNLLPFGTPAQVREQVLRRCGVFAKNGGFVFNAIHNVQAQTPTENIVAMVEAVREAGA